MTISIKNIINSDIAAFHSDGLLVFKELDKAYVNKEFVTISFVGIQHCATQFLNASIGKMYLQYDPVLLNTLISYNYGSLVHLHAKIDEVKDNAVHSKEYDSLIEIATS